MLAPFHRCMTLVQQVLVELFMIVTDTFYRTKYRAASQQLGLSERAGSGRRGFVVIQIDSLAHEHLLHAMEHGYAPYLKKMLDREHVLQPYTCGLPSSTPAAQSAIMYGNSYGVPAFRWYDKERGRTVSCKLPANLKELEENVGQGRRGILEGGSSYSNLISGGAARSLFTLSTFGQGSLLDGIKGIGFFVLFALSPVRTLRVLIMSVVEALYAFAERTASYWKDKHRVRWEGAFPLVRVLAHVLIKEMQTFAVMVDMYRGIPNIYTTYNLYDNMAHHFGPLSRPALRAVRAVDRQVRQIDRMRRLSAARYDLYVLSDHGQTPAIPFRALHGESFGQYVAHLVSEPVLTELLEEEVEARSHIAFLADELRSAQDSLPPTTARAVRRIREYVERRHLGDDADELVAASDVVAVGCSGMAGLYFNQAPGHLDLTRIQRGYPGLIDRLVDHPSVGLVIGREGHRVVILGKDGRLLWDGEPRVVGVNPLRSLDPAGWTLAEVLRIAAYPKSADLIIFGSVLQGVGVAFEEQMGVHGAFGGPQAYPFIITPKRTASTFAGIATSHDLYTRFSAYLPRELQKSAPPKRPSDARALTGPHRGP